MYAVKVERAIARIPGVAENGAKVAQAIHRAVLSGGNRVRTAADILHGTWLGHPLHPVLTDVPIGAWTLAMICDLVAAQCGSEEAEKMADALVAMGAVAAVPTALAGVADYSAIDQSAVALATIHGLLNSGGLLLNLVSIRDRAAGNRSRGVLLSAVAFGALNFSAWLGGEMVYNRKIGVNHREEPSGPAQWQIALASSDLPERTPKRVAVEGAPVLLYRDGMSVYAIGAVCSHAGGPLDEGKITDHCVQCPWHDSVFDLRDGSVVHGPATYPEPAYDARLRDGQVEVRLRPAEAGG
ncbi:MAG: Rieske 2Fe-2S domain-containing protein [Thermomicrobia bacterium]|nr:Rieske 2Fe-2S domain-containing protein [Thermomicrobia bacterium]